MAAPGRFFSGCPVRVYADYFLAYAAGPGFSPLSAVPAVTLSLTVAMHVVPFERPVIAPGPYRTWAVVTLVTLLFAAITFVRSYRRSDDRPRARLRWALLCMSTALACFALYLVFYAFPFAVSSTLSGSMLTPGNRVLAVSSGIIFPISFGYAALRERVVDVRFAMSRTLVFGVVSMLVLVFLTVVHWLLGRLIEHSGIAFGLEGIAAIGLGLVLHRASRGINLLVDRVIFRGHHEAEER